MLQVRSAGVVWNGAPGTAGTAGGPTTAATAVLPQFSNGFVLDDVPASSIINRASFQAGSSVVWVSLLVIAVLVVNTVMVAFGIEVPWTVGIPPVQVMNISPARAVYSSARISGL